MMKFIVLAAATAVLIAVIPFLDRELEDLYNRVSVDGEARYISEDYLPFPGHTRPGGGGLSHDGRWYTECITSRPFSHDLAFIAMSVTYTRRCVLWYVVRDLKGRPYRLAKHLEESETIEMPMTVPV